MPNKVKVRRGKRSAVIAAAAELFVIRGYDGTSMDAIAEAAHVSRHH
ncbi:helix-turn-helix domain-containing protein [Hyphomicrobium sp.]